MVVFLVDIDFHYFVIGILYGDQLKTREELLLLLDRSFSFLCQRDQGCALDDHRESHNEEDDVKDLVLWIQPIAAG